MLLRQTKDAQQTPRSSTPRFFAVLLLVRVARIPPRCRRRARRRPPMHAAIFALYTPSSVLLAPLPTVSARLLARHAFFRFLLFYVLPSRLSDRPAAAAPPCCARDAARLPRRPAFIPPRPPTAIEPASVVTRRSRWHQPTDTQPVDAHHAALAQEVEVTAERRERRTRRQGCPHACLQHASRQRSRISHGTPGEEQRLPKCERPCCRYSLLV